MSVSGTVRKWDVEKGWGFISGADGGDYFVHFKMLIDGGSLQQGAEVQFTPEVNDQGKAGCMQASNVSGPGVVPRGAVGKATPDGSPPAGALSGIVTKWVMDKGFGFITDADGKENFVHHTALGGGSLKEGALAYYFLSEDSMSVGKMKAVNVSGPAVQGAKPWSAGVPRGKGKGGGGGGMDLIMGPGGGKGGGGGFPGYGTALGGYQMDASGVVQLTTANLPSMGKGAKYCPQQIVPKAWAVSGAGINY